MSDNQLSIKLREGLEDNGHFQVQNSFTLLRSAVRAAENQAKCGQRIDIVGACGRDSKGFSWISKLVETSTGVITLFDDPCDKKLPKAIHSGVSGFLLSSSTVSQIASAITTVANGGVVMSPEILKRIMPCSNGSRCKPGLLTDRESGIVRLLVKGYSLKEIASSLSICYVTVQTHVKNIHKKLGIRNAAALVSHALRDDLV